MQADIYQKTPCRTHTLPKEMSSENIWKIQKKGKLNSEKIWKMWKKVD